MSFDDLGRYSDPALLILISLAQGERHGYAMMTDIQAISGVSIGPGTLYGALARLEEHGWIEAVPAVDRRRPYRITPSGMALLRQQLERLQQRVTIGMKRLGEV